MNDFDKISDIFYLVDKFIEISTKQPDCLSSKDLKAFGAIEHFPCNLLFRQ